MDVEMDPLIGRTVGGRYTLLSVLGHGGEGVVYLAEQEGLGREVVVKVMRPDVSLDPLAAKRFDRESRLVASLHHPHIVAVHDLGRDDDGLAWFVMERLTGETLKERLKRGPLSLPAAIAVVRQVALALGAAHARGVVHRDIKPANIQVLDAPGATPLVKVLDFGIAREVNDRTVTRGEVLGTEGYVAPERLQGEAPTTKSDCFSLGVVFCELLTGKHPFVADTLHETHTRILDAQPALPGPIEVDSLITRLLKKDPTQRIDAVTVVPLLDALGGPPGGDIAGETRRFAPSGASPASSSSSPSRWSSWLQRPGVLVVITLVTIVAMATMAALPAPARAAHVVVDSPEPDRAPPLQELSTPPPLDDGTRRRVDLGRLLYHDPALSKPDGGGKRVSCATCHPLGTDSWGTTKEGLSLLGQTGQRMQTNTPPVVNAAVSYKQAWKGDSPTVEDVILRPLTRKNLMGEQAIADIPPRLAHWAPEFAMAGLPLTADGMLRAIGDYVRFIEPRGSAFDLALRGEQPLGKAASDGQKLFEGFGCVGCHQGEGIGANLRVPFGVIDKNPYRDRGVCSGDRTVYCRSDAGCVDAGGSCIEQGLTIERDIDHGAFRVPSLRNVEKTAPYFHDGSAASLDEAVRVMARVQLGRTLGADEVASLVAFLDSLTAPMSPAEIAAIGVAAAEVQRRSPAVRSAP